jgi:diguanylate cyclase (GGDEF)-like protein
MRWIRDLFALPEEDPGLASTQLMALAQRVPTLYCVLIFNVTGLAETHYRHAPILLTVVAPVLLVVMGTIRLAVWLYRRSRLTQNVDALIKLRQARRGVVLLGASAGAWAFLLLPYGDEYTRFQVEMTVSLTVMTCAFCLITLRSAAILLSVLVGVPFTLIFLHMPSPAMRLAGASATLVLFVMVQNLLKNAADFVALSLSERELKARQQETQRLLDENSRLANLDPLTNLPNRRRFFSRLEHDLADAEKSGERLAVALMDLDRFKGVNDIHGHAAGDRLLIEVGDRLRQLAEKNVFIARLGGDEFGVILTGARLDESIAKFCQGVKQVLEGPCLVGDRMALISSSAGVAVYPDAADTAEMLFERADYALYHGKQTRKGGMVLFSAEHETRIRAAARVEEAFQTADLEAEMWVAFQPIVDVKRDRVVAFEALARWQSRELGPVSPVVFVPIAERSQMIGKMTRVLLKKALDAARHWPSHVSLCFNLSAQNLASPDGMEVIQDMLRNAGLSPCRLEFEVTETALLHDFEQASACLQALREIGVRIALDDFGTGFSSLSYVNKLKLDKIKIDRSFVIDVDVSRTSANIVKTILALCENLNLDCIVEGVETQAQLKVITSLGCRLIQGYLISKPVAGDKIAGLVRRIEQLGEREEQPYGAV